MNTAKADFESIRDPQNKLFFCLETTFYKKVTEKNSKYDHLLYKINCYSLVLKKLGNDQTDLPNFGLAFMEH